MSKQKKNRLPLDNLVASSRFPRTVRFHHRWLEHHRLLDRPWFILASAPEPSIPRNLPDDTVYAYVKFAGRGAKQHGLPDGDLTLATGWNESRWDDLTMSLVLRVRNKHSWRDRFVRLFSRASDKEMNLFGGDRDDYVLDTMRSRFRGVGEHLRPSSGLTMIAFALAHRVPAIIIAGLSLDRAGHEYNDLNSQRNHAAEDRAALMRIAAIHPHVTTTESSLADATGIPLYRG